MQHPSNTNTHYTITHTVEPIDFDALHAFLSTSDWSRGIPRETMERSIRGSLPFVLRDERGNLAGFARVITDRATFGYIGDLFVLPRQGLVQGPDGRHHGPSRPAELPPLDAGDQRRSRAL